MTPSVWNRLDLAARGLTPFALTALVVMIGMVPLHLPDVTPVMPAFGLIAVYYWVVRRPDLMPAWAVFLIGLGQDLVSGGRLGVGPFVLLLVFAVIAGQRRFFAGAGFAMLWAAFLPVAAGTFLLAWVFNSLIVDALIPVRAVAIQYLTTVAVYPALAWLFDKAQQRIFR